MSYHKIARSTARHLLERIDELRAEALSIYSLGSAEADDLERADASTLHSVIGILKHHAKLEEPEILDDPLDNHHARKGLAGIRGFRG